jgi:hypothetical protein
LRRRHPRRLASHAPAVVNSQRQELQRPASHQRPDELRLHRAGSAARAAIVAEGLDPTIGYLHTDPRRSGKDSGAHALVLDLMEPLRPCADAAVLAVISEHTFAPDDLHVTTEGACRLNPQLARYVAAKVLGSELPGPQTSPSGGQRSQAKSVPRSSAWPAMRIGTSG